MGYLSKLEVGVTVESGGKGMLIMLPRARMEGSTYRLLMFVNGSVTRL